MILLSSHSLSLSHRSDKNFLLLYKANHICPQIKEKIYFAAIWFCFYFASVSFHIFTTNPLSNCQATIHHTPIIRHRIINKSIYCLLQPPVLLYNIEITVHIH